MKIGISVMVVVAISLALAASAADAILVTNFDTGSLPVLNGRFVGAWHAEPANGCETIPALVNDDATGKPNGRCLKLRFNNEPSPHYSGIFIKFSAREDDDGNWALLDASACKAISFWAKGTPSFGLEIKSKKKAGEAGLNVAKIIVRKVASDKWTKVTIPLANLTGSINTAQLAEIVCVFSDTICAEMRGTLFLDEINLGVQ